MYDVEAVRKDFPILSREVNGVGLVYLDSAASAQKPRPVLEAISKAYGEEYANVHRGLHFLSNLATDKYEAVRSKIRAFVNASYDDEIVFTTGSTDSINLAAYSWAMPRFERGDEIILSVMEHHANIVPWHFLRERSGVKLVWVEIDQSGALDPQSIVDAITPATKLIAVSQMSNVLGTRVDIKTIAEQAQSREIPVLVDGSQSTVHGPIDVLDLGIDFFAFTGHKLYGPSASGALYAKRPRLREMRPFRGGGDMIRDVQRDNILYADPPLKMEAGTPPIVPIIGLGAAIDYLSEIGMENISRHEQDIADYASHVFSQENWIQLHGSAPGKGAIFSFTLDCPAHAHDISTVLDQQGIAVRAGHHCAQPLMKVLGVTATCRASFGMYSTKAEVDKLMDGLRVCVDLFS